MRISVRDQGMRKNNRRHIVDIRKLFFLTCLCLPAPWTGLAGTPHRQTQRSGEKTVNQRTHFSCRKGHPACCGQTSVSSKSSLQTGRFPNRLMDTTFSQQVLLPTPNPYHLILPSRILEEHKQLHMLP